MRDTIAVRGFSVNARRLVLVVFVIAAGVVGVVAIAGGQTTTGVQVGAFPMPGTLSASPETQISLRGAPAAELGSITVRGSRTGAHTGKLREHSDGKGASFVLDRPLRGDERVTVQTDLNIPGASDGDFSFRTVTRPKSGLQSGSSRLSPSLLKALTGQKGVAPKGAVVRYRSRPDLRPPEIQVFKRGAGTADGLIFIAPKKVFGAKPRAGLRRTADRRRRRRAGLVRAERPRQRHRLPRPAVSGQAGAHMVAGPRGARDRRGCRPDRRQLVQAGEDGPRGNGYQLDFHETTITPQGTLLGLVYNPVARDLSYRGGPNAPESSTRSSRRSTSPPAWSCSSGTAWARSASMRGAVPFRRGQTRSGTMSIPIRPVLTNDGNLLISARETWAGYKLDRKTGRVMQRIGGKKSDLRLAPSAVFAWQHDIQEQPDGTLRIFDNQAAPKVRDESRGLILSVDAQARRANRKRALVHKPDPLLAGTQGNVQGLSEGRMFVGWGSQGYFSEFAPDGTMLFDARIARGQDTYRAYRFAFAGTPGDAPALAAADGGRTVYASFNGATELRSWEVLAGDLPDALAPVATAARRGFETRIRVRKAAAYVAVRAKDAEGKVLGTSKAIRPER